MTKTTPDGTGTPQQKRKKLAKKEARLMLAITQVKKNIKKTEDKISGAEGKLRTCTEELHVLEEKLAKLQHPSDDILSDIVLPDAETETAQTDELSQITIALITDPQESSEAEVIENINIIVTDPPTSVPQESEASVQDESATAQHEPSDTTIPDKTTTDKTHMNHHEPQREDTIIIPYNTTDQAEQDHVSAQGQIKTTRFRKKKNNTGSSDS